MSRPELYPVKKILGFDRAMLGAVEKWRAKQQTIPTVSEAIRQLINIGLATSTSARSHGPRARAKGPAAETRKDHK